MAEPRILNVGTEEITEKEKGESGLSSAQVGTEAKTIEKSNVDPVGVYVADSNVVNDNSRELRVSRERPAGIYKQSIKQAEGFERSKGDKNIVNTITVDEVKALIKQYGGGDSYTKEEIDQIVETMRKGLYQEVDTTEYPTLEDFLDSDGEEGIIYLYPVGNEGNNYYQYIWETTKEWISLGTTVVDLSQYAKLTLLAPIYDSTATYSVGAKCVYNGKLYTCSTAITQAEEWNSSHWTEISVSSRFVDLDSNQTITGVKTFKDEVDLLSSSENHRYKISAETNGQLYFTVDNTQVVYFGSSGFRHRSNLIPWYDNQSDMGSSTYRYKDLYLSGKIKDGTNEFNADNVLNVINAIDIVNNTLTQEQYDLVKNGKLTLIKGTIFSLENLFITSYYETSSNVICMYESMSEHGSLNINKSNLNISKESSTIQRYNLRGVNQINGKIFPAYPSSPATPKLFTYGTNNTMSWDDPFNPASVSLSDGGTISDTTLQANIQYHRPIVLNGFTCYFSCDDGTNYQYTSMRYDANANKNHINVITINKSTWEATFHTSDLTLN